MPWATINLIEGHSAEQKQKLHERVADAISQSLDLPLEYVRIQLVEMTSDNHSIAGKTLKK